MILYVREQFCNQFENDRDLEDVKELYNTYSIIYSEGYKKLCVKEQKINLDEFQVNQLFEFWPELELSYSNYGGQGCAFSLNIKIKD